MATTEHRSDAPADLLTVEEAARRLRIGRTTMYGLISAGEVETVTIGRRRLVPPECVAAYVAVLRTASQPVHLFELRRPRVHAGDDVPVEVPDAGHALREAQMRKDAVAAYELVYAALGA